MTSIKERTEIAREAKRNVPEILKEIEVLATLSRDTALSCFYVVFDSQGKPIVGISVRFAELISSCWGNIHTGAKIIGSNPALVTVQGFVHDFEKNTVITVEVQRAVNKMTSERIIQATNAASSIAFRNAIFKAIPAAITSSITDNIKNYIITEAIHEDSLEEIIKYFNSKGISRQEVLNMVLGKEGGSEDDLTFEDVFLLIGLKNAIDEGDTTPEEAFGKEGAHKPQRSSKYNFESDNLDTPVPISQNGGAISHTTKQKLKKGISFLEEVAPIKEEVYAEEKTPPKETKPKKKRGRGRPRKTKK